MSALGRGRASIGELRVGMITYGLYWGQRCVLQQHEVARLDIAVEDLVGMALGYGPEHCPHIACNLPISKQLAK